MKDSRGFLLLEVLVALAILSGGVVAVFQAFSTTLKAGRAAERRFQGGLAVEAAAWELEQSRRPPSPPDWSGASGLEAQEAQAPSSQPWRAWTVRMRWNGGQELSLESYLPAKVEVRPR